MEGTFLSVRYYKDMKIIQLVTLRRNNKILISQVGWCLKIIAMLRTLIKVPLKLLDKGRTLALTYKKSRLPKTRN